MTMGIAPLTHPASVRHLGGSRLCELIAIVSAGITRADQAPASPLNVLLSSAVFPWGLVKGG